MPRFSEYFSIDATQAELDFVDISTDYDTPVYVDPYAITILEGEWAEQTSEIITGFFHSVIDNLRSGNERRAENLLSNLSEPKETFLGVSQGSPKGRGVGHHQSASLIKALRNSLAFSTGILSDVSELALYVENFNRDKVSDLTTNIIREKLVEYTQEQCELYEIDTEDYNGPPIWNGEKGRWEAKRIQLPHIDSTPILLVPKVIVRRTLSLDGPEFYKKNITDFLVSENLSGQTALVETLKNGKMRVKKSDVREKHPYSKDFIAEIVGKYPELLDFYKNMKVHSGVLTNIQDDDPSTGKVATLLAEKLQNTASGKKHAEQYHGIIMHALNLCFYPHLTQPKREWEINDGRKRIDIAYTNSSNSGFFQERRQAHNTCSTIVIVECKNYSSDLENAEFDQLLGRFDDNKGKLGFLVCRNNENRKLVLERAKDAAKSKRGYIILLEDADVIEMLRNVAVGQHEKNDEMLRLKFREIIS